jgi:hypothetical protein
MGAVDVDENGVPDVFDMPPTVVFESSVVETVFAPEISLRMKALSKAVENQNPLQDSLRWRHYAPPLKDATLTLNGVVALSLAPDDGKWDEVEEDLSARVSVLPAGVTRVGVNVRNVYGRSSEHIVRVLFANLRITRFHLELRDGGIDVLWSVLGNPFEDTHLDLYRIEYTAGREDSTLLISLDLPLPSPDSDDTFFPFSYFDDEVQPGHRYGYFVEGHFALTFRGVTENYCTETELMQITAPFPITRGALVSNASPNPFHGTTTITIDVPPTYVRNPNAPGDEFDLLVSTGVTVEVYDVLGRLTKSVHSGGVLTQKFTLSWDGTNQRNEPVPSGIYFIKASAGRQSHVQKVVVVK